MIATTVKNEKKGNKPKIGFLMEFKDLMIIN